MILSEALPAPDSYAAIGWVVVILASCAFGFNQVLELVNRARGKAPHPPNSQLEMSIGEIDRRVTVLEEWKDKLAIKMDADKTEILQAGQEREARILLQINTDRGLTDGKIDRLPERIIAILKNTGAI